MIFGLEIIREDLCTDTPWSLVVQGEEEKASSFSESGAIGWRPRPLSRYDRIDLWAILWSGS